MLTIILLLIAAVCFGLAVLNVASKINLIALGRFSWVLSVLVPLIH